mgnify:CR=1 FL=1
MRTKTPSKIKTARTAHAFTLIELLVVIAIIGLAVASLVTAGLAIFREKERSVILIVVASLTFLLVVTFAVGEALGGH